MFGSFPLNAVGPPACQCNYSRGCATFGHCLGPLGGFWRRQLTDRLLDVARASLTPPPPPQGPQACSSLDIHLQPVFHQVQL